MSRTHDLDEYLSNLSVNGKELERVSSTCLLGTQLNEHLIWTDEINSKISSCYGILSIVKKLKHFAPFQTSRMSY